MSDLIDQWSATLSLEKMNMIACQIEIGPEQSPHFSVSVSLFFLLSCCNRQNGSHRKRLEIVICTNFTGTHAHQQMAHIHTYI